MKTINLGSIQAVDESTAVAAGKAVVAALETEREVEIDSEGVGEDVRTELVQYLGRRGVSVKGSVATWADAESDDTIDEGRDGDPTNIFEAR